MRTISRRGFTLVELLVVIGIIAVLIGILIPVLARARDRAQTIQCANNLRQVMWAMTLYENDFKMFPYSHDPSYGVYQNVAYPPVPDGVPRLPGTLTYNKTWVNVLEERRYLPDVRLAIGELGTLKCPASPPGPRPLWWPLGTGPDYGYNYYLSPPREMSRTGYEGVRAFWGKRSNMTKNPGQKILLAESWNVDGFWSDTVQRTWRTEYGSWLVSEGSDVFGTAGAIIDRRHMNGKGVNVAYLAGNVELVISSPPTAQGYPPGHPFGAEHFMRDPYPLPADAGQ